MTVGETTNNSEAHNVVNGIEPATSSTLDGEESKQNESEPDLMERTKEVMENIGIKINSI